MKVVDKQEDKNLLNDLNTKIYKGECPSYPISSSRTELGIFFLQLGSRV